MTRRTPLILALTLSAGALATCGGDGAATEERSPLPRAVAPGDTVELDRWNLDEVVVRLEEAGLGVQRTGEHAMHPALRQHGDLLLVGGNELRLFVYEDAASRRAEGAALGGDVLPPESAGGREGRVIASNNVIAIYYPRTEIQLERVTNALLARYTVDR